MTRLLGDLLWTEEADRALWYVNRVTYGEVYVSTLVIHDYPVEGASTLDREAIANAFDGHVSDGMEFGKIRFVIR